MGSVGGKTREAWPGRGKFPAGYAKTKSREQEKITHFCTMGTGGIKTPLNTFPVSLKKKKNICPSRRTIEVLWF